MYVETLSPSETLAVMDGAVLSPEQIERLIAERRDSPEWQAINRFEREAAEHPQIPFVLDHVFTPGLYTRIAFLYAGVFYTTQIHLVEHPYTLASGRVEVATLEDGWKTLRAPHVGVTKPGTRRLIYVVEDAIWITHHVNPENETDWEKIGAKITYDPSKLGHMDDVDLEKMAALRQNLRGQHP